MVAELDAKLQQAADDLAASFALSPEDAARRLKEALTDALAEPFLVIWPPSPTTGKENQP